MVVVLIALLLLISDGFLLMKMVQKQPTSDDPALSPYGLRMTEEETELERQSNEKILNLLETRIKQSGYFRSDKLPELMRKLRAATVPFGRVNTKAAFGREPFLTLQEKKSLGLNPRMKYSKEFIGCFETSVLGSIEPKSVLEHMHVDAFHRVSREKELQRLRELGFKKINILPVGDEGDCGAIKRNKKVFPINEVPELPLPDCDAPFCRCMYISAD